MATCKWLNSYLRCTQTEERLSDLALIHYKLNIDDECKRFVQKHPRILENASLLFNF